MVATIGGLPNASLPLTGDEYVELEQDGSSVKALSAEIGANVLTQPFLVTSLTGDLQNERVLVVESGVLSAVDSGPNDNFTIGVVNGGLENAKLANMGEALIKGRPAAAGTGAPMDLNGTQVAEIIGDLPHTFTQLTVTNSNEIDLVDTDVALRIGATDPDTEQHIEVSPDRLQSKLGDDTASDLYLNLAGGDVTIGDTDETGIIITEGFEVSMMRDGIIRAQTGDSGWEARGALSNDPGGLQDATFYLSNSVGLTVGSLGFRTSTGLYLYSQNNGGGIYVSSDNSSGVQKTFLQADPGGTTLITSVSDLFLRANDGESALWAQANGPVYVYYNNAIRFSTISNGIAVRGSFGNDPNTGGVQDAQITLSNSSGTVAGRMRYGGTTSLSYENITTGGHLIFTARNSSSVDRTIVNGDPDGQSYLRAATDVILQNNNGENVLFGAQDSATYIYYNGGVRGRSYSNGWGAYGSLNNDPDAGEIQDSSLTFANVAGTTVGRVAYLSSVDMYVGNLVHGGGVVINGEDDAGSTRTFFNADPNSFTFVRGDTTIELQAGSGGGRVLEGLEGTTVTLFYNDTTRFQTRAGGVCRIYGDGSTVLDTRYLSFNYADGSLVALTGHNGTGDLVVRNDLNAWSVRLKGRQTLGSTLVDMVVGNPDSDVELYYGGTEVARTSSPINGGFIVNNTQTGTGFERVLTESDRTVKVKSSNTGRTGTTPLEDTDFTTSLTTGLYLFEMFIYWINGTSASNLSWEFAVDGGGPNSGRLEAVGTVGGTIASVVLSDDLTTTQTGVTIGASAPGGLTIKGSFDITSDGDFKFLWSTDSGGATTTLVAGSALTITKVS